MPEEPPVPGDEQGALQYITALIKNYEPQFELQGSFTPGLFGSSDPQYPAARRESLYGLVRKGFMEERFLSWAEASDTLFDDLRLREEADSRLNWRVTVRHTDYFIHIMALDTNFQR